MLFIFIAFFIYTSKLFLSKGKNFFFDFDDYKEFLSLQKTT